MRTIQIAMIGLGTVGTGVAKLLAEDAQHVRIHTDADFAIKWVVVRDPSKNRELVPKGATVTTDLEQVIGDPDIEIVLELMGTVEPARTILLRCLRAGKHVITANKAVLAEHGREIFRVAHENDRVVCFEAAVAGGIPIVASVGQDLAANRIHSITGILNGTSNYILTAMHRDGYSYETALKQAQERGFAEADPTLDVNGTDAAQKLSLLARLGFSSFVPANEIRRQGIDTLDAVDIRFAKELGYVIKLLAVARIQEGKVVTRVAPMLVPADHQLAQIHGEYNAVRVVGHAVGDTLYSGKGAGMMPTASSVVADLMDLTIGRALRTFPSLRLWEETPPGPPFATDGTMQNRFYLRYSVADRPGVLAQMAGILGQHGINISSVIQHETGEPFSGTAVPLIVMTHLADEGAVLAALEETDRLDVVQAPTVCLHVAS